MIDVKISFVHKNEIHSTKTRSKLEKYEGKKQNNQLFAM